MNPAGIQVGSEVAACLQAGGPVVALESTVIAHGLPYPDNAATARAMEGAVRQAGAVPATIAVLGGTPRVGLTDDEIELLASAGDIPKVSRRDLAVVIGRRQHGATTVAATLAIAERSGLEVFATGGIGGVHRGAEETFDISADLDELARCSLAVICAGAKSILDLGRTLEALETRGVPVIGFRTDDFPAFFSRESGHPVTSRADSVEELAAILRAKQRLELTGCVLIGQPVPRLAELGSRREIERLIDNACAEASRLGITGKALTPFLLDHIRQATGGASLETNRALLLANARLAGELAVELASRSP